MHKTKENIKNSPQRIWAAYEKSCAYMDSIGMTTQVQKNIDFYEGRQWPAPTKETLGMPRPIIDITAFTVDNKCANISGTPVKLTFTSTEIEKAKSLNQYTEYWLRKQKFKNKLKKLVRRAAVDCGACFHTYLHKNELKLELIDARNLHVSDPTSEDLQEMEWIIISSRRPISAVKRMADKDADLEGLTEDNANLTNNTDVEQDDSKLCTVLTRYFRMDDGEVYFERVTKTNVINKARPIAPDIKAAKESEIYKQISSVLDEELPSNDKEQGQDQENTTNQAKASLYPVFFWRFKSKRNCFYGRSLVEPIIPDQKAINTTYGLLMLGAQIEATGKTFVKNGTLRGQELTNSPLQVVTDYYPSGNGVYKLPPSQLNTAALALVETLIKYIRFTNNVTEINTGEAYGANASGSAIAQLQSQASQATDSIREDLWEELEEFGQILKQGFSLYFKGSHKKQYKYREEFPNANGILEEQDIEGEFDGNAFIGEENSLFDVQVKAIKGTRSSVSGDIQMLEAMLQGQLLSAIEFIEMYPSEALTDKDHLLSVLKAHQHEQLVIMQQQLAKSQQDNKQLVGVVGQLSDTIKTHKETMESAYKVLSVDEKVKQQAVMEGARRMNAEASLTMAQNTANTYKNAMDQMALDVVRGNVGGGMSPTNTGINTQPRRRTLVDEENDI